MFSEKIQAFCKKHYLIKNGDTILIAVSGGPDSMALLHYLKSIQHKLNLTLIALTVDHMLRGEQSKEDVAFVRQKCQEWNIKLIETSVDVNSYKKEHQLGTQVAARELRYRFFLEQMRHFKADSLAIGHHGDDQIETIFMRLMRGTSIHALKGIPYKRAFGGGFIIRPFLAVTKDEIEGYCKEHAIVPRRDPSNQEPVYTRNALRLHMLPFVKEHNPMIHKHLQHLSENIEEDEKFLSQLAKTAFDDLVKKEEESKAIEFEISPFKKLAQPLQRRCFHLILNYLYEEKMVDLSFNHYDNFMELVNSYSPNQVLHFPSGLYVIRAYNTITFTFERFEQKDFKLILEPDGKITLPDGAVLKAAIHRSEDAPLEDNHNTYVCDSRNVAFPLIVRNRQPGDRIKIRGLDGTKKVKDIFIDQKIPKLKRNQWPIVTDADGKVLWVVGLKKATQEGINTGEWLELTYEKNLHV